VLAARRGEFKRVILPRDNESDLRDLPDDVREETEFVFAERIQDVLREALPKACTDRLEAAREQPAGPLIRSALHR
jgi:ATP-dependent Lon protease